MIHAIRVGDVAGDTVEAGERLLRDDLGGWALGQDLAVVHRYNVVADAGGLVHAVGDDEDGHPVAELVHELERLMNFYRYTLNNRDHEFNRIIVTGDIPNMKKVLDGLRGRMPQPIVEMPFGSYTDRTDCFGASHLSMAVPFGLALRGRN